MTSIEIVGRIDPPPIANFKLRNRYFFSVSLWLIVQNHQTIATNADIPIIINLSEYVGGNSSPIAPNAHIDKAPEAKLEPTIVIANSIDLIPLDKTGLTT